MIVKKLILYKYKRYFLNNIEKLEYTPIQNMQMIIGSNGSGKSQTMKELNPLPADLKREFYENGYKYIEIEHLNKLYILSSGYTAPNKHSFMLDNIELNPGGTRKVQLELIRQHFNITPDIVNILLNNDRFTSMSIMDRKKWLSELSTIDYTYAVTVYNKLKQRHRDIVGGIKLLQEDIIKYESNKINQDELDKLIKNKEVLEDYYKHIVSLYDHKTLNHIDTSDLLSNIEKISNSIKNTISNINTTSIEDLNKILLDITTNINNIDFKIKAISKELEDLDKIVSLGDIEKLKQELQDINSKISIEEDIKLDIKDYVEIADEFLVKPMSNFNKFISILEEYKDYKHILNEDLIKYEKYTNNIIEEYDRYKKRLLLINTEIEHINNHKKDEYLVTCPKCENKWYNGYNIDELNKLNKSKNDIINKINELTKSKEHHTDILSKMKYIANAIDIFRNYMSSTSKYLPIWEYIINNINIKEDTATSIQSFYNKLYIKLSNMKSTGVLYQRKLELSNKLKNIEDVKEINLTFNKNKIRKLEEELVTYTKSKQEQLNLKVKIETDINNKNKLLEQYNLLKNLLYNIKSTIDNNTIKLRNQYIGELTDYIKEEMINIDQVINNSKSALDKIAKSKIQLDEYKSLEKLLHIMVKELSPTEGLIAKSINSFLNVFIKEMNDVINSIWTYEIELLPCDISEDNDLDYKFRVRVNNDEVIEDISKLSSSMKEIVDLAFRLVFAKYMKLTEVPLYLDEFGATFDKAHRTAAYNVIDKILSSDYRQVFIICHYESIYSSLRNIDFNVLDPTNIDLPIENEYNQVMKIS